MTQVFTSPQWFPFTSLDLSTLLVLIVTFAVAKRYCNQKRPGNLPPLVPGGWPLLHHLPTLLKTKYHVQLDKWAKEHGNLYSVRLWRSELIVVSGYTAVKEMMEKELFSTRVDGRVMAAVGSDQDIFLAPYGETYKQRRKFATSVFRRLGVKMGPGSIQNQIQEEASSICGKISGYAEQPFDISDDLTTATGNIICALVFGHRFEYGDTRFLHLQKMMKNLGAEISKFHIPFITYIILVQDQMKNIRFLSGKVKQFIREEIDRHRLHFDPEDPRDFIDCCLLQLDKQEGGGTWLNDENVVYIVFDLFIAGMDTSANTLTWAILYMIIRPDIQEKVQTELDSVLGANKPSLAHRDQLPFTTATIMEAQRIRHIGPALYGRIASESSRFRGYDIPKGRVLIPNLMSFHMDPAVWPNPDVFDPNRFLDKDGKVVTNPPSFLPFSTSRRNCLGEQLAKMELFLLFSTILQHFSLKVPEGAPNPSTKGVYKSLGLGPEPFQVCAVLR